MAVHLFVRSAYSLLNSTVRISALIEKAKAEGFSHVSLCDQKLMYGAAEFLAACKKANIHGIIGLEAIVEYHEENIPFVLLAKDNIGYRNLIRLSSWYGEGSDTAPLDLLKECAAHCVLIAYGEGGYMDRELVSDDRAGLNQKLAKMKQELPPFDIALSYQEASLWKARNATLKAAARAHGIHTVAMNKIYYLESKDADAFRCICGIRENRRFQDPSLPNLKGRYFLSIKEMEALYDEEDIRRTDELAAECRGDYVLEKTTLPVFENRAHAPSDVYLRGLCAAGLKKRLHGVRDERYESRLAHELDVIIRMHFENYFLIVYDFIRYARKSGIYVGPGRGSACGSLTAYCLGITQIDPIRYNLLFERFLNPERVSMPDIDTDIPDDKREQVIRYVVEKYGNDKVADIVTFGTFGARQSIRDVGKYLNLSVREIDLAAKLIPSQPGITLKEAWQSVPRLRQLIQSDTQLQKMWEMAVRLEGLPRHASTHPAGIIISSKPLTDIIPVTSHDGMLTSQYEASYLEERGLIKMDFLALRNLTMIDDIVKEIQKSHPDFDIMKMPLDHPSTYQIFSRADTTGVFQFESEGMKSLLRRMRPDCFADVVAALALFRPASKDSIPTYIANKKNPSGIRYPSAALKPVLEDTYGVMIYQEQAMLTAEICAGFTLGKADVLRKAMSKKNMKEIDALKMDFMNGCLKNGYPQETADDLFELVSRFGGYGFNKSHAVAYGLIACQTAYLKADYPLHFYIALLNSVVGDVHKTSLYISEARSRKIQLKGPDVNTSEDEYAENKGQIVIPLSIIKGIGVRNGALIVAERKEHGSFQDFFDFTARVFMKKITRKMIEMLIDAGALDCFGENRRTLLHSLDDAVRYSELVQVGRGNNMTLDFGIVSKPVVVKMKDEEVDRSQREREALGFSPGNPAIVAIRERCQISCMRLAEIEGGAGRIHGFAMIESVKDHRTKKGNMMAFLKISDETGSADAAIMPWLYAKVSSQLARGAYILFDGKISDDGTLLMDRIQRVYERGE